MKCVPLLVAALMTLAAPAYAQDASGVATELFNAGRELMRAGDYQAACPKLAESARLDSKVGTLARLAECEEKIGHLVSARSRWEQAANVALSMHDDRLAHVKSELARLDSMVPKVVLSVEGPPPVDLRLRIDELEIGLGTLGVPLPVEAGSHHIVATAPGKTPWSTEIATQPNGAVVAVHVPTLVDAPVVHTAPAALSSPPTRGLGPLRTAGIVAASAGVLGLGLGIAYTLVAIHKNDESNQQPGGCDAQSSCPASAYGLRNDARTAGDLSTAFFVAGGVLAAGGVVLWLAAPREGTSVSLTPTLTSNGGGLRLRGGF